jgi:hypothetical protein
VEEIQMRQRSYIPCTAKGAYYQVRDMRCKVEATFEATLVTSAIV